jgi:soluble lytic murein transglycosylase-like protein
LFIVLVCSWKLFLGLGSLISVAIVTNFGVLAADLSGFSSSFAARHERAAGEARLDARGDSEQAAGIPDILSAADIQRYRQIFEAQDQGDWGAADALIEALDDRLLLGHVRKQRYMHPTAYRSTYDELHAWLESNGDHPGALRVYRLAEKKRSKGAPAATRPETGFLRGKGEFGVASSAPLPALNLSAEHRELVNELAAKVRRLVAKGTADQARDMLSRQELRDGLSSAEYDAMRAMVARAYFVAGDDREALAMAERAVDRSGTRVPAALWTAGLAAWRLGAFETAADHFSSLARSGTVDEDFAAGGAYWAARAYGVLREPMLINEMLRLAAAKPRSIYGLLALRSLFDKPDLSWDPAPLTPAGVDSVMAAPAVRRAIALAQVGQHDLAEDELRKFYPKREDETGASLLAVAEKLSLPSLEIRLGSQLAYEGGRHSARSLYPVPDWTPRDNLGVDRALVFALVRQESVFDAEAKSRAGARGLMQLMPRTATFIDGENRYRGSGADELFAPELNLKLGLKYVRHLLDLPTIDGNLVFMMAAYNAGPGRLGEWVDRIDLKQDPLLFIESIPARETRRYIRRVLSNLWLYRLRLGQPVSSLEQIAAGRWPTYTARDADHDQLADASVER